MNNDGKNNSRSGNGELTIHRCGEGHAFFYPHGQCPVCGAATHTAARGPAATIISHTIVRVSPSGQAFRLGLAEISCGAKTLCIIDDGVELNAIDTGGVLLYLTDGLYHARSMI